MASSPDNSSPNLSPPPSSPPPSPDQSPPPSPPDNSSPPPPKDSDDSSPPPKDSDNNNSSPPPKDSDNNNNSSPPPPKDSDNNNNNSSPPPPKDSENNNSSPPPSSSPPKDNNNSRPSPPSPNGNNNNNGKSNGNNNNDNNNNNNDNNNASLPPPPPPPFNAPPGHKSPPSPQLAPPSHGKSSGPSSNSSPESDSSPSNRNGNVSVSLPTIVGLAVGAGALLVLMIVIVVLCSRKKKKQKHFDDQIPYYTDHNRSPAVGAGFYNGAGTPAMGAQNMWQDSPHKQHAINILPPPPCLVGGVTPPRGNWQTVPPSPAEAPPQPVNHSAEVSSSNLSGPYGPPLPPPPPSVALGFNQSSFTYEDLTIATQGFAHANLLGQGGFGYVHKGVLPNGKEIAVKSLKVGSGQGDREFQAEVDIISRVHHRHLVALVGFCMAGDRRMLVYEFIPNKTLEFHLHGKGHFAMNWATRVRIALGGAKGLAYLHEDCHPRIIHRDIKSANILLDYSFEAKVADFGLAKLTQDNNTHVSTRVMGTFGYLAPEYASSGKLTDKSDVFSYGVVLLELITGRRPVDDSGDVDDSLVDWARTMCPQAIEQKNYDQIVDPSLENKYNPDEMERMIHCAVAAIRHSAKRRPKMRQIVRALEEDISLDDLTDDARVEQSSSLSLRSGSVEEESASYSADLKRLRKMASAHREVYESSEFGHTSEYGLNPSPSSSDADSDEHTDHKDRGKEKEKVDSP